MAAYSSDQIREEEEEGYEEETNKQTNKQTNKNKQIQTVFTALIKSVRQSASS